MPRALPAHLDSSSPVPTRNLVLQPPLNPSTCAPGAPPVPFPSSVDLYSVPRWVLSAAFPFSMIGILCQRKNSAEVTCPPSLGQGSVSRSRFVRVCTLLWEEVTKCSHSQGEGCEASPAGEGSSDTYYWEVGCQEGSKWRVWSSKARNFQNGDTGENG